MPHFENIEQYESSKTRNGRKQIMPIAPHSLQATEYRPRKQERPRTTESLKAPAFPEVEFEPVSVSQMEKEFRQAGKSIARPRRKKVGLKKRISGMWNALLSLVRGKEKSARKPYKAVKRRRRPEEGKEDAPKNRKSGGAKAEGPHGKRGNRRRSNRPPQGSGDKPPHSQQAGGEQKKEGPGKDSRRKSQRSRRGKRNPGRQQPRPGSQKDSNNKSS